MKNLLVVLAIFCASFSVKAQVEPIPPPPSPQSIIVPDEDEIDEDTLFTEMDEDSLFKHDAERLMALISKSAFKPYIDQFALMVAEENQEAFRRDINDTFPELFSEMATIYMETFTHDEIRELILFYRTPVGKKMADNSASLGQKGIAAGQAWGVKVQEIIGKYQ